MIRVVLAVLIGLALFAVLMAVLRALTTGRAPEGPEPEDVADLDVFFVCQECGTEFKVTRVGVAQVPRHCGEVMEVVRRAPGAPP